MIATKEIILYKRNAKGQPIFWNAKVIGNKIRLNFGIVGKQGTTCDYIPPRGVEKEWKTIVAAKRREGGMELSEVHDTAPYILRVNLLIFLSIILLMKVLFFLSLLKSMNLIVKKDSLVKLK